MNMRDIVVIILAGGGSTRMGTPKALLKTANSTLLETHIEALRKMGFVNVVVVLGHGAQFIKNQILREDVHIALNPSPEAGQFSSIKCGLRALESEHYFVLPVDMPVLDRSVWETLISESMYDAVQPEYAGRAGHPVLISRRLRDRLIEEDDSARLDILLRKEQNKKRVAVQDQKILANINTPEEFKILNSNL